MPNSPPSPASALADAAFAHPFDAKKVARLLFRVHERWFAQRIERFFPRGTIHADAENFITTVMVALYDRLVTGKLTPPDGVRHAGAWLIRCLINLAETEARRLLAAKRGGKVANADLETSDLSSHSPSIPRAPSPESEAIARLDNRRRLAQVLAVLDDADFPARYRVAFRAHYAPPVERPHLEAANAQTKRTKDGLTDGLCRSVDETGHHLDPLLQTHPHGVHDDDDGREHLAFILRSSHDGPVKAWAKDQRKERLTAMDTVRKWVERANERVREALPGGWS